MKEIDIVSFFKKVPLLENLEEKEFEELAKVAITKDFEKGKVIFYEEDYGTSLYIIVYGKVKISVHSNEGKEHTIGYLGDKDFFGEISLLDGQPRSTNIISLERVKVITISRENFLKLLRNNPHITHKIILSLCKKIRITDKHIGNLAFLSAPGRVARTISQLAEEKGTIEGTKIVLHHNITRQEFANITNTSRETLTRIIMGFQDDGILLSEKNELIILDKKRLDELII